MSVCVLQRACVFRIFNFPSRRQRNIADGPAHTAAALLPKPIVVLLSFKNPGEFRVKLHTAGAGVHLAKARGSRVPNEYFLHRFQTGKNNTLLLLKKIKVAFRMFLQNGLKRFFSRHDSHGKQPRFVLSKPGCHAWRHIQTGLKFPLLPVPPNNAATGGNGASGRCLRGRRCIFQKAVQKITCDIVIEG